MDPQDFARRWIDDWNSHDIERVLAHYADDAEFRSPMAERLTGDGVVRGRDALRAYWGPALIQRPALHFTLKTAFAGHRSVAIHYGDELGRDVVETLVFNADGQASAGYGCYA